MMLEPKLLDLDLVLILIFHYFVSPKNCVLLYVYDNRFYSMIEPKQYE